MLLSQPKHCRVRLPETKEKTHGESRARTYISLKREMKAQYKEKTSTQRSITVMVTGNVFSWKAWLLKDYTTPRYWYKGFTSSTVTDSACSSLTATHHGTVLYVTEKTCRAKHIPLQRRISSIENTHTTAYEHASDKMRKLHGLLQ